MKKYQPDAVARERILSKGCYGPEKNRAIYEKWFAKGPRGRMQTLIERYSLAEKAVADVGCGYGNNLLYFGPGSYGIDISKKETDFANAIGLSAHHMDFLTEDTSHLPKVDAVVCYAVIEHVESPHIALRKIYNLLKPSGLAIIYVPTLPALPILSHLPKVGGHFSGHLHGDHINAFTPATIRFMAERAGFNEVETTTALSGMGRLFDVPPFNRLIDGTAFVGKKIDDWKYPPQSGRIKTETGAGFEFTGYFKAH